MRSHLIPAGLVEPRSEDGSPVDYAYVFGNWTPAVRYDPHVHDQSTGAEPDLREISDLLRPRSEQR